MAEYRIVAAGDSAIVVEFEARIDPALNARVIALAEAIERAKLPGVRDVVPTYRSVAIQFDPLRADVPALHARIERDASAPVPASAAESDPVPIPVAYGGTDGPDLDDVARFAGLQPSDVVAIHTQAVYRVFMLGFVPGFAYLGTVDERIAMPRHSTPRVRVPQGSVGIAGVQTGIYPLETPGGWRLIGRTAVKPFDPDRARPILLKAGDRVRFYAV